MAAWPKFPLNSRTGYNAIMIQSLKPGPNKTQSWWEIALFESPRESLDERARELEGKRGQKLDSPINHNENVRRFKLFESPRESLAESAPELEAKREQKLDSPIGPIYTKDEWSIWTNLHANDQAFPSSSDNPSLCKYGPTDGLTICLVRSHRF